MGMPIGRDILHSTQAQWGQGFLYAEFQLNIEHYQRLLAYEKTDVKKNARAADYCQSIVRELFEKLKTAGLINSAQSQAVLDHLKRKAAKDGNSSSLNLKERLKSLDKHLNKLFNNRLKSSTAKTELHDARKELIDLQARFHPTLKQKNEEIRTALDFNKLNHCAGIIFERIQKRLSGNLDELRSQVQIDSQFAIRELEPWIKDSHHFTPFSEVRKYYRLWGSFLEQIHQDFNREQKLLSTKNRIEQGFSFLSSQIEPNLWKAFQTAGVRLPHFDPIDTPTGTHSKSDPNKPHDPNNPGKTPGRVDVKIGKPAEKGFLAFCRRFWNGIKSIPATTWSWISSLWKR